MRVITGKARGVQLKTPDGLQTRPTADRVKEALFSIIQFDIFVIFRQYDNICFNRCTCYAVCWQRYNSFYISISS